VKHSKNCVCKACCAARLASPKADDPLQGSIFEPVKTPPVRPSFTQSNERWTVGVGKERKEAALTAHDQHRRATLIWLRDKLRILFRERERGDHGETWRLNPYVTADDAERFLDKHSDNAIEGNGSWKGALFRSPVWKWNGQLIPSVQAQNNGRGQRAWRYVGHS
jgi:hypothetical protein